jgi:predicted ATPase
VTINRVHIKNFKSIVDLSLDLAPINVFIGENGSGKSNILEALAFAAAAAANKLDNEFLVSRGIRVTDPHFMRSAFTTTSDAAVSIDVQDERGIRVAFEINTTEDIAYPKWSSKLDVFNIPDVISMPGDNIDAVGELAKLFDASQPKSRQLVAELGKILGRERILAILPTILAPAWKHYDVISFGDFIIYSPEVSALRTFEKEGQILPLGIRGEGLLKLLRVLATEDIEGWRELQHNLGLLDWLSGVDLDHDGSLPEQSIRIRDRFIAANQPAFDQRSANEGFLYLLFFFALILSKTTPRFFAIENVDTSLNPKACSELMYRLASLAIEHGKQILFTTHNPSLLDGMNLHDDKQRLFVVFRDRNGHTVARRIMPPQPIGEELPIKLSEAFTRGLLGGIPQNF